MEGVKSQIRFLMKCKKHNIIPKGLKSGFLASISNFSQSGQRLCERFQKKLLHRILSDKHWLLEKFQRKCIYFREQLNLFNLGSRFYFQNDSMIKNKSKKWSLYENRRLSRKFVQLMQQSQSLRNKSEKDKATDKSRI